MICSTIPNFNLLDNQSAVCHYGQVKKQKNKKNQMFLDFISIEKRVCRSFLYKWQLKVFFTNYNPPPGIARGSSVKY